VLTPLRSGNAPSTRAPSPNLIPVSLALNAGIYNVLFGLRAGAPLVIMNRFETAEFAELVRRFEIRSTVLPPAAIAMLNDDPEVTDSSGDQLQPGPGASGFIDRPIGLPGESSELSGSPGSASEPALVAPGSSLVTDAKINADDTGRLVSGTDANGDSIPPDTFVGAVSDTGPYALSANATNSTASNNYAKPWTGTFQLLNDSGQPVTLPKGFDGNVTLSAEGGTSTVGTTTCPSGSEAATTSTCVTPTT